MITYACESLSSIRQQIDSLLVEHWEEIALYKDRVPLAPNWAKYQEIEEQKKLVIVSARSEGTLIGYCFWFFVDHIHYQGHTVAVNDVIFLKKEFRRGRIGLELIRQAEYYAIVCGADRISWHVKTSNDWTPILTRMGYALEELIMSKYTGK